MFNTEKLQIKWKAVLEHKDCAPITDPYKLAVTTRLLENQEIAIQEERAATPGFMTEDASAQDVTSNKVANYDPVLISLVRRAMPNVIAYDIAGVQPMTGPTGLIFAMKSEYRSTKNGTTYGDEALHDKPNTAFSGRMTTQAAEKLSGGYDQRVIEAAGKTGFAEMGFRIEKTMVAAKSRALRATYTTELAQDLKAVHGMDAESELANILSSEIIGEINRELIDGVNNCAKLGGQLLSGVFDLNVNSDGRWSVEKYKGLILAIEREANKIAVETRRGKGNILICSSNVASAIAAAGMLSYTPALAVDMQVDPVGNLFAGTINGRTKVFIDPFAETEYVTIGYRGSNPYDAGVFYCPYVPLAMMRAVDPDDFQPRIGFKTRYGLKANPFVTLSENDAYGMFGGTQLNPYFRTFTVEGLIGDYVAA